MDAHPVVSARTMDAHAAAPARPTDAHHALNADLAAHWTSAESCDSANPHSTIANAVARPQSTVEPDFFTEAEAEAQIRALTPLPLLPQAPVPNAHPHSQVESAAAQLRDSDVFQRRECVSGSSSAADESPPRQIHDLAADAVASVNLAVEGVDSQMQQHSNLHENAHGQQQRHQGASLPPRPDGKNNVSTLPPRPEGTHNAFGAGRVARAFGLRLPSLEQAVSSAQAEVEREEEALRSARAKRLAMEREAQECRIRASPRDMSGYATSAGGGTNGALALTHTSAANGGDGWREPEMLVASNDVVARRYEED